MTIVSSPVNTECTAMLCIVSISLLVIFFSGLSFSFAGPITRGNLPSFKNVLFNNGSRIQCQEIGEENRCPPGTEIVEECDYPRGPMKCVPCRVGYYQCDYVTSDVDIKCYPSECPEQGKETTVKVTMNKDGTCKLECVCNEALGYSGHPMDCKLHKTLCGINSELRNGSCVGCDEGFHNPDREFGRCVPKPTAPTSSTSSFKTTGTMETTGAPVVNATTKPHTTIKPYGEISPRQDTPLNDDPSRPVTGTGSSDTDNTNTVQWIVFGCVAVVIGALVCIFAVLARNGTNIIACCSGQVTQNPYSPVHSANFATTNNGQLEGGVVPNGNSVPDAVPNGVPNAASNAVPNGASGDIPNAVPYGVPNADIPNASSISDPSSQSTDQEPPETLTSLEDGLNVAVIFAKHAKDEELADEIKQTVGGVELNGGKMAKVWDFNHAKFGGSKISLPHEITSKCQLTLIVLTCNTANDADCPFMIEEAVGLTRLGETSTYSVRLIHTEALGSRTYSIPHGLAGVEDLDWTDPGFTSKLKDLLNHIL